MNVNAIISMVLSMYSVDDLCVKLQTAGIDTEHKTVREVLTELAEQYNKCIQRIKSSGELSPLLLLKEF